MALRNYDLALIRAPLSDSAVWAHSMQGPHALVVNADRGADPVLSLLNHLRRTPFVHEPAYC
jgi:hypothetical protein